MEDGDKTRFEDQASVVRAAASVFLNEWFGERCGDFKPNCVVCQRWKALDDLLDNVFTEIMEIHVIQTKSSRTREQVLAARASPIGCCNRHADNMSCNCLEEAIN